MRENPVTIYTDGAAEPNPGPGGYGVVVISALGRKELSAGYKLTTNNRMELLAVIAGLESLEKPSTVTVYSDSRYVVDSVQKGYVMRWNQRGWIRGKNEQVKNVDLWERFLQACKPHIVRLSWVPGHAGITENERCDRLAVESAQSENLIDDTGYERHAVPSTPALPVNKPEGNFPRVTHTRPGEPCRKCNTQLVRRQPERKKLKRGQTYYYEWYLLCPGCGTMYMVDSAKRYV